MGFGELDSIMSDSLPHPVRHRTFLRLADAATVIVDRLREFVPATVPCSVLAPGVDPAYLSRRLPTRSCAGPSGSYPEREGHRLHRQQHVRERARDAGALRGGARS
jgi:hypothetical protein